METNSNKANLRRVDYLLFTCEICGKTSHNNDEILACEKRGRVIPLVNVGDVLLFKDDVEAVLGKEAAQRRCAIYKGNPLVSLCYDSDVFGFNELEWRTVFRGYALRGISLNKYEVLGVRIYGHDSIYYGLGIDGASVTCEGNWEISYTYPVIKGNEIMTGILKAYNSK